eukprot:TRINITY_DN4698_c0_g1_i1.p1 TRINITY_DN4698_c0_g1~~TRINITY_DN4698_c0_g1_i1.p1  ORF type:complete len:280 (-),score=54.56 TRINITY_DN4698_c0_g1_i1:2-841(-)
MAEAPPPTVEAFLLKAGFPQYKNLFGDSNIQQFLSMTPEDLASRGVPPGPRNKICMEMRKYSSSDSGSKFGFKATATSSNTSTQKAAPRKFEAKVSENTNKPAETKAVASGTTEPPTTVAGLRGSFMTPSSSTPKSFATPGDNSAVNLRANQTAAANRAGRFSVMTPAKSNTVAVSSSQTEVPKADAVGTKATSVTRVENPKLLPAPSAPIISKVDTVKPFEKQDTSKKAPSTPFPDKTKSTSTPAPAPAPAPVPAPAPPVTIQTPTPYSALILSLIHI